MIVVADGRRIEISPLLATQHAKRGEKVSGLALESAFASEADSVPSMRAVLVTLMLCAVVLLVSGWTSGTHQAPPTCSPNDLTDVQTSGTSGTPLYTRWCGPARARVHVNGASFLIRGGRCLGHPTSYFVRVGLIANPPARPAKWVGLFIRDRRAAHAGTFRLAETATSFVYATIQLGGPALEIAGGTITIARSMRDGTFALRLQDATRVTGTWTCG